MFYTPASSNLNGTQSTSWAMMWMHGYWMANVNQGSGNPDQVIIFNQTNWSPWMRQRRMRSVRAWTGNQVSDLDRHVPIRVPIAGLPPLFFFLNNPGFVSPPTNINFSNETRLIGQPPTVAPVSILPPIGLYTGPDYGMRRTPDWYTTDGALALAQFPWLMAAPVQGAAAQPLSWNMATMPISAGCWAFMNPGVPTPPPPPSTQLNNPLIKSLGKMMHRIG